MQLRYLMIPSFEVAATLLLQGMTAHYLSNDSYEVKKGDIVLIHAASGGVGQLLTQLCKNKQAIVVGLTTSENKKARILELGADVVFNLKEDWKQQVINFSKRGVDVVYDSVGSTLMDSIEVTKECGHIVFYGMSGGNPDPVNPRLLMDGSKTLTGGDLWSYLKTKQNRLDRANDLFEWMRKGSLKITEPVQFLLENGKQAHDLMESGQSAGKILLIP